MLLWIGVVLYILYNFLRSCLAGPRSTSGPPNRPSGPSSGFRPSPGAYGNDHYDDPPPPYAKTTLTGNTQAGWQPGFWSGIAAGSLGTHLWDRSRRQDPQPRPRYDWERPAGLRYSSQNNHPSPRRPFSSDDRGEGPSSGLGSMRSSTGIGGSSVR